MNPSDMNNEQLRVAVAERLWLARGVELGSDNLEQRDEFS